MPLWKRIWDGCLQVHISLLWQWITDKYFLSTVTQPVLHPFRSCSCFVYGTVMWGKSPTQVVIFSAFFLSKNLFTRARIAIGLIKFFSDKSMLPISNVFVIYCGKKKEIEMLAKICKTFFKMYICGIFVWLVFSNKKQSSNFFFNKRTLSIRKSLVWQWGAK